MRSSGLARKSQRDWRMQKMKMKGLVMDVEKRKMMMYLNTE